MMTIDRRDMLLGGLATAAFLGLGNAALARAPLAARQVPGVYRQKIGDLEVTAILDGSIDLDTSVFKGADPAELKRILAAVGQTEKLTTAVNAFVINSAQGTVLVDTGAGGIQAFGPNLGKLPANLAAAGIEPAQVDAVIITHLHPDHAEGLTDATGAARFPNAELIVHEQEIGFWTDDGVLSRMPAEMKPFFESARKSIAPYAARTRRVKAGEVLPGLSLELSPGHTPGHSLVRVASGASQMLLIADTIHNSTIHTARPQTGFAFDADPAVAAQSRQRVLDMVSADGMLMAGTHIAFPGFGKVVRDGSAYRWVPAEWAYQL